MKISLAILLLLTSTTLFAQARLRPENWATRVIGTELKNMYQVDSGVYRSEQPDNDDLKELTNFGLKEIISLREYHDDEDEAEGLPLTLHHLPWDTTKITHEKLITVLKLIKNRKGSILIHCWHGSDRTGTAIAAYRIVIQNWSHKQAIDEMVNGGYGYHKRIYPYLVDLVKTIDREKYLNAINN